MTAIAFKQSLLMAAIFHGNAFAEIERDTMGRPLYIWPLHPDRNFRCGRPNQVGPIWHFPSKPRPVAPALDGFFVAAGTFVLRTV
jgi:hypothetical protein